MDIRSVLETNRKELLDLGLRNPLLNFKPRTRAIEVVGGSSQDVFSQLRLTTKALTFKPMPEPDSDGVVQPSDRALKPTELQTKLEAPVLAKRLLSIHRQAKTVLEEQGINVLYLATGFLRWFESESSSESRVAPLLLLPVALERSSAQASFRLKDTGDDLESNLSLLEKMKLDFGIELPALSDNEDFDVESYFEAVRAAIRVNPRWGVVADKIHLGFFSFAKLLMYRDLSTDTWGGAIGENEVLNAILGDGFSGSRSIDVGGAEVERHLEPDSMHQVVDADSSQTAAMIGVNQGKHLVIQGPPGTGKSQTITNLLADAIGEGKRVLFVAEKMAALEVVKRRLDQNGLGDAVLELHSRNTKKKALLEELERTLALARATRCGDFSHAGVFETSRDSLNAYCRAVNEPIGNSGVRPIAALGRKLDIESSHESLPRLPFEGMSEWSQDDFETKRTYIENLQACLEEMGQPTDHPFHGSGIDSIDPERSAQMREGLTRILAWTRELKERGEKLARELGLEAPSRAQDLDLICRAAIRASEAPHLTGVTIRTDDWQVRREDIRELLASGRRIRSIRDDFEGDLIPQAWKQNVLELRATFLKHGDRWYRWLSGKYRKAHARLTGLSTGPLPKDSAACLARVEAILDEQNERERYDVHAELGEALFGAQWQGDGSDWDVLDQVFEWVIGLYRDVREGTIPEGLLDFLAGSPEIDGLATEAREIRQLASKHVQGFELLLETLRWQAAPDCPLPSHRAFDEQIAQLESWTTSHDRLDQIARYNQHRAKFLESGLGFLLSSIDAWDVHSHDLVRAFECTWYTGLYRHAYKTRPAMGEFDALSHDRAIGRFRDLDRQLFEHGRERAISQHRSDIPRGGTAGAMSLIYREIQKKRRHLPIRKLMEEAGPAIQAIKPVMMMSPISISQYIPPRSIDFDLVVFDEASQVKPVDALGALLRGKQAVVVGDTKQLPPTSFFDSVTGGDEEATEEETAVRDMESILGLFVAKGAPEKMLKWHYRSRDESLIAVSNQEFYDNKLVTFPSPGADPSARGLVYHHVSEGAYDRGGSRANRGEARAVARAAMEHARRNPGQSLGIVAFSSAQRDVIDEEVERLRREHPETEEFFAESKYESFFVKNLENVQGDERDVIFISIGYGRTPEGKVPMSFGPLNSDGGERRLNVLITRARRACEVFTNLSADDIDLSRTKANGVAALKRFLRFAAERRLDMPVSTYLDTDSPFEDSVIAALQRYGVEIEPQVGCGGYRIDIGVKDPERPGRYVLGIECDGASYHSGVCARDRDRLRQQVLEGLGWRIHRIWSTDWYRNRERELTRTLEVIGQAIEEQRRRDEERAAEMERMAEPAEVSGGIQAQEQRKEAVVVDSHELDELSPRGESTSPEASGTHSAQDCSIPKYVKASFRIELGAMELHEAPAQIMAGWVSNVVDVEGPVHRDEVARRITELAGFSRCGSRIRKAVQRGVLLAARRESIECRGEFLWQIEPDEPVVRNREDLEARSRKIELIAPEEVLIALRQVVGDAVAISHPDAVQAAVNLFGFARVTTEMRTYVSRALEKAVSDGDLVMEGTMLQIPRRGSFVK